MANGYPIRKKIQNISTITDVSPGQLCSKPNCQRDQTCNCSFSLVTSFGILTPGIRPGGMTDKALYTAKQGYLGPHPGSPSNQALTTLSADLLFSSSYSLTYRIKGLG